MPRMEDYRGWVNIVTSNCRHKSFELKGERFVFSIRRRPLVIFTYAPGYLYLILRERDWVVAWIITMPSSCRLARAQEVKISLSIQT